MESLSYIHLYSHIINNTFLFCSFLFCSYILDCTGYRDTSCFYIDILVLTSMPCCCCCIVIPQVGIIKVHLPIYLSIAVYIFLYEHNTPQKHVNLQEFSQPRNNCLLWTEDLCLTDDLKSLSSHIIFHCNFLHPASGQDHILKVLHWQRAKVEF